MVDMESLEKKISAAPEGPGVYIMKDGDGIPIYIGKAKSLRKRLRTYLGGGEKRHQVRFLMKRVADIECILTETEKDALILEDTLIKRHKPRYNINLRDDKTYVSLRIDPSERFPRITIVRRVERDGALYFGPYSSARGVRETLKVIQEIFPLRTCSDRELSSRKRPCIDYEMKRCLAPCVGLVDEGRYRELVKEVILFLKGRRLDLIELLKRRMEDAAERLEFEEAARLRDSIDSINLTLQRQIVARYTDKSQDVIGIHTCDDDILIDILFIRDGRLIGDKDYFFRGRGIPLHEVVSSFVTQFYRKGRFIPDEVIVKGLEDRELLEERLTELKGRRVRIIEPKRGDRLRLIRMAERNAENLYGVERGERDDLEQTLEEIMRRFHLSRPPARIEAVDISNISGDLAVGAVVAFEYGEPDKSTYRRYRIRGVKGVDDYAMMREVILRHYKRRREGGSMPDLLMVDGGKGQLAVALGVLKELGISINIVSIAKGRDRGVDRFYTPGRKNPVIFKKGSPPYLLLQRIRDEAHRFAITYHRGLRSRQISSLLDEIPGIGEKKREILLRHFRGLKEIKEASIEELSSIPMIDRRTALNIYRAFHGDGSGQEGAS